MWQEPKRSGAAGLGKPLSLSLVEQGGRLARDEFCVGGGDLCERKLEYRKWSRDPEIARRTDFFAAAADPTLDSLDSSDWWPPRFISGMSRSSTGWLRGVSGRLETHNRGMAQRIKAGEFDHMPRSDLNVAMVRFEQDIVQKEIDEYIKSNPGHANSDMANINQVLDRYGWRNPGVAAASDHMKRPMDFRRKEDRVLIGLHSIRAAAARKDGSGRSGMR